MNDATKETTTEAKRERQFGRVYDFENGTINLTAAFDPSWKGTFDASKIPENVVRGFLMQSVGDYIVQEATDALKDETEGDEAARRAAALKAAQEAYDDLVAGKVDFRTGVGLGGNRAAIGLLGSVLFELGKTFVKNAKGETLSWTDLHGARAAVKSLYLDTDEVSKPDPRGGKDKDGNPRTIKVTSRMIFNVIQKMPEVEAALKAKQKPKTKELGVGSVLG